MSLNIGKAVQVSYRDEWISTGIHKSPVEAAIRLSENGLEGDEQADLVHHGGPDKALCVYPLEHYAYWERQLCRSLTAGAFGENATVAGMDEHSVCIGDVYRIGESALVQITQPRQPCFKLAMKWNEPTLVKQVVSTGYTGYYMRVLTSGYIRTNDRFERVERDAGGITIAEANRIRYAALPNEVDVKRLLAVHALSDSWRQWLSRVKDE